MQTKQEEGVSPTPFYLHKIYSIQKQLDISDILQAIHPTHAERLFMSGFLKYAGYSYDETFKIIDEHCQWEDYNPSTTSYQLATVYKQPHRPRTGNTCKPRARKWQLTPTEKYRCKYYRSLAAHRELQRWARENDIPIYDAAPELPFNPAKIGGFEK